MKVLFILVLIPILIGTCNPESLSNEESVIINREGMNKPAIAVSIQPVEFGDFPLKIISNGILRARQKVEIKSETLGRIVALNAMEGLFFEKGERILEVNDELKKFQLRQSQLALEEALIKKADLLIRYGGQAYEDSTVSTEKLLYINTLSGYKKAHEAMDKAKYELGKTSVYAPFNGVIANVGVRVDQQISVGQTICTLINPASLEVIFFLMEEQALSINKGQFLKIKPVSVPHWIRGSITAINPMVNDQGLVQVFAQINSTKQRLWDGMKVKVVLEQPIANQIIIPKTAIVLRAGKPVVFTYESATQLAKWNFISIAYENDVAAAIAEGLKPQDTIIYKGNLNLDHEVAVQIHSGKRLQ